MQKTGSKAIYNTIYVFDMKVIKVLQGFKVTLESEWKELVYYFYINNIIHQRNDSRKHIRLRNTSRDWQRSRTGPQQQRSVK